MVFRDSLKVLPGSLKSLAESLCPELGSKGEIDHGSLGIQELINKKLELLEYMKQDIYLLGGILKRAQEIYWSSYNIDIVKKITLPSQAIDIFRLKY